MAEFHCKDSILHYEQFGEGPDVVWISRGSSLGGAWHEHQVPYFRQCFRNTTYDARGIGQTKALKPPPWTIEKDFVQNASN